MKTKEELNALKEEVKALSKKLAELTEDELQQISGGAGSAKYDVFSKVEGILEAQLGIEVGSVLASSSIIEDLGADSLDVVDILHTTEKRFQVKFSPTGLENIKTVQDLCDLVSRSL